MFEVCAQQRRAKQENRTARDAVYSSLHSPPSGRMPVTPSVCPRPAELMRTIHYCHAADRRCQRRRGAVTIVRFGHTCHGPNSGGATGLFGWQHTHHHVRYGACNKPDPPATLGNGRESWQIVHPNWGSGRFDQRKRSTSSF